MHAQMASERGAFDFDAVAPEIGDKMIRRHPHVFGEDRAGRQRGGAARWDEIKREEKRRGEDKGKGSRRGHGRSADALPGLDARPEGAGKGGAGGVRLAERSQRCSRRCARRSPRSRRGRRPGPNADAVADEIGDLLFCRRSTSRAGTSWTPKRSSSARRTSSCGVSSTSKRRCRRAGGAGKTPRSRNWTPSGNRPRNRQPPIAAGCNERNPDRDGLYYVNQTAGFPATQTHHVSTPDPVSTLAISGLATLLVKSMIAKYSQVPASSGLTGAETAQHILRARGIHDVTIAQADGMMGDHYNPPTRRSRSRPTSTTAVPRRPWASPRTSAATPSSISRPTRRCNCAWRRSARRSSPVSCHVPAVHVHVHGHHLPLTRGSRSWRSAGDGHHGL